MGHNSKHFKQLQAIAQHPVFGFQLWEVAAVLGLGYFGFKAVKAEIDSEKQSAQEDKMGTDKATQQAALLYRALIPGGIFSSTNTQALLDTGKEITNFAAVKDAYEKINPGRVLAKDLQDYVSADVLLQFFDKINKANQDQGTMDLNWASDNFHQILYSIIPINDAQENQIMQLANDINNSGATKPVAVFKNIATVYKAKWGADLEKDLGHFWGIYDPDYVPEHQADFYNVLEGDNKVIQFPSDYKDPYH